MEREMQREREKMKIFALISAEVIFFLNVMTLSENKEQQKEARMN